MDQVDKRRIERLEARATYLLLRVLELEGHPGDPDRASEILKEADASWRRGETRARLAVAG